MLLNRFLLIALLGLTPIGVAGACADPLTASFRDLVAGAPTIFVFQLTSATYVRESLGGEAYTEYVVGRLRVVDSLQGKGESFTSVKYWSSGCGSTRMSVGQLYLAATSQSGPTLELWGIDQALLDLTLDFYDEKARWSPAVDVVKRIISGSPVPVGFPRKELESPLLVYPAPPPPVRAP